MAPNVSSEFLTFIRDLGLTGQQQVTNVSASLGASVDLLISIL